MDSRRLSLVTARHFDWKARFGDRHNLRYKTENRTRESIREKLAPNESAIKFFMQIDEDHPAAFHQAEKLESICPESVLQRLKESPSIPSADPVAWMDDRSLGDQSTNFGTPRGHLSAVELYWALQQERFTEGGKAAEGQSFNSDRRLIYITDLDSWTLGAIILTSSNRFAWAVSRFFFHHLALRPLVDVRIKLSKPALFSLEFHLPFFAWRNGPLRGDHRRKQNGQRLRRSQQLNFLMIAGNSKAVGQDCIYEACVSCVVTGYNDFVWTALLVVDTYFDDELQSRDKVDNFKDEETIRTDPLLASRSENYDVNKPIGNPREYFLRVVAARAMQVSGEWDNVVSRLCHRMENCIQNLDFAQSDSASTQGKPKRFSVAAAMTTYHWIVEVNELLATLTKNLAETVEAWQSFNSLQASCFFAAPSTGRTEDFDLLLYETERSFVELQRLGRDLNHLRDTYEQFKRSLELHLSIQGNEGSVVLQQVNMAMLHVISPPALAAGILQTGLSPFANQLLSFILLTIICAATTLTAQPALVWWSTRKKKRSSSYPSPPGEPGGVNMSMPGNSFPTSIRRPPNVRNTSQWNPMELRGVV